MEKREVVKSLVEEVPEPHLPQGMKQEASLRMLPDLPPPLPQLRLQPL